MLITIRDSMSGYRCQRGSSRIMLSRRCADDGGGLRLQCPARGLALALARAAGDVLAARSGSASMCLAQTWHIPGVDLPRTRRAVPPAPGPAAARGRFSRAAVLAEYWPGHRPPAASPPPPPRGQSRHQPQPPAIFRLTTAGPQLRHTRAAAVSASTRTTPPVARTVTVTVFPAAPEPLCRTLFPNSSLAARRHPGTDAPARAPRP